MLKLILSMSAVSASLVALVGYLSSGVLVYR